MLGFHGDERKSGGIHGRCEVGVMETPGRVVEEVKESLTTLLEGKQLRREIHKPNGGIHPTFYKYIQNLKIKYGTNDK